MAFFVQKCCRKAALAEMLRKKIRPNFWIRVLLMIPEISPVTGLEWPRGFLEVEVPRFHENGTKWW